MVDRRRPVEGADIHRNPTHGLADQKYLYGHIWVTLSLAVRHPLWGAGQQQVRNIWTNVAVFQLCLWMHTLVELSAWNRHHDELVDRNDSPWDDPQRRPSHANRGKALRQQIIEHELSTITAVWRLPRKILQLAERLVALAA